MLTFLIFVPNLRENCGEVLNTFKFSENPLIKVKCCLNKSCYANKNGSLCRKMQEATRLAKPSLDENTVLGIDPSLHSKDTEPL